jgi:hypothetical protein
MVMHPLVIERAAPLAEGTPLIDFESLVDSYFDERRWRKAAPVLRDYFAKRRQLLEKVFNCRLTAGSDDVPESAVTTAGAQRERQMDRRSVTSIALACLEASSKLHSPFAHYMEGAPGPLEETLLQTHHRMMSETQQVLMRHYRTVFRDALLLLHPDAESRHTTERELLRLGLPKQPDFANLGLA